MFPPPRQRRAATLIVILTLALLGGLFGPVAPAARAAPGNPDDGFAGFSGDGLANLTGFTTVNDLVVQPDGKLVIVGDTSTANQLAVARYLPSGLPDPAFDGDGRATFPNMFAAVSVGLHSDGRIVVGGNRGANHQIQLARLMPGGALDPSFDGDGWAQDGDTELRDLASLVVQADDKIVVCASAFVGDEFDMGVARYTSIGARDNAFSDDGKVTLQFGGHDYCEDVALAPGGKLVAAGFRIESGLLGVDEDFAIARLTSSGAPDNTFDGDGKLTTGFDADERAEAIAVQPDGKIVVLGLRFSGSNGNAVSSVLARYLVGGALDGTFGTGGKVTLPAERLTELALQPNGKLVLVGRHSSPSDDGKVAVWRLYPGGLPDETFDADGVAWYDFGNLDEGRAIAVLPDGRLVVGGRSGPGPVLMRLWPDGTFDASGQQTHAIVSGALFPAGSNEYANALAVQPDGKLLVAGELVSPNGARSDAFITRFLANGQVDSAFGSRGTTFALAGLFNAARAIAVQPDGKVVIAGITSGSGVGNDLLIARRNANGTVDGSFGDSSGAKRVDFGSGHDELYALALTPPDPATGEVKIVVVGRAYNGAHDVWVVLRLTGAGQPDLSFGPHGLGAAFLNFSAQCGSCPVSANAVAVQPDGSVVVAGHVNFDTAIARLTPAGLPDPSFGTGGLTLQNQGGHDGINALVLAPDGRLFGAGSYAPSGHNNFILTEFSAGGVLLDHGSADWSGGNDIAYALDWRDDGQLVAAGFSDGKFAWAQFSAADVSATPLVATTDFVGTYEVGTGVQFTGDNQVVVAGWQEYQGDWNIALARFETSAAGAPVPPPDYRVYLPLVLR